MSALPPSPMPPGLSRLPWLLLMMLALAPGAARAQEGGLGLDLSAPATSGPDLRPSLAVVGVSTDGDDEDLANPIGAAMAQVAQKRNGFHPVLTPQQAREALGDGYAEALKCGEPSCLESMAAALDVERLVLGHLTREGKRLKVQLLAFSRGQSAVEHGEAEARTKNELSRRVKAEMPPLLETLSTQLAQLKITTNLSGATVMLGEREIGSGSIDKAVPAGHYTLKVAAPEYVPFEQAVTLEPGGKQEVEANLAELPPSRDGARVADALKRPVPDANSPTTTSRQGGSGNIFSRPALYVAAAGVLLLAGGVALGLQAQDVSSRNRDGNGDGLLDVTRTQLVAAQRNAQLANGLMAGGGALTAGGAIWFILTPTAAPGPAVAPGEPSATAAFGLGAAIGGTF